MVSSHLKNISQIGSFPQVGVKIKNIWNHNPDHVAPGGDWFYLQVGCGDSVTYI